jgi:hypothetical protein
MDSDTVSVFEQFERNSGFVGGKFLERARMKNTVTQEYFKEEDFFVGSELTINTYQFRLIDVDAFTARYMKGKGLDTAGRPLDGNQGGGLVNGGYGGNGGGGDDGEDYSEAF